jgi:lipopolysaccharide export system permease protein
MRKRGEITAVDSLTFGPRALYLPIGICAGVIAIGLVLLDEFAVVTAGPKVDQITATRFNRWGDWRYYYQPKQWYRRGERIFYLKTGDFAQGYEDITVLKLTSPFTLSERIDAARMVHIDGTRWRLFDVVERRFSGSSEASLEVANERVMDLGAPADAFRIRKGRPEQMHLRTILDQIAARAEVGLPTNQFELALHNRFAYPLAGFPAALLAVGLALRRERKGHLTTALVEGLAVAMTMWGLMVVCKTLAVSDRLSPVKAAWAPVLLLVIAAAAAWGAAVPRFWRARG